MCLFLVPGDAHVNCKERVKPEKSSMDCWRRVPLVIETTQVLILIVPFQSLQIDFIY